MNTITRQCGGPDCYRTITLPLLSVPTNPDYEPVPVSCDFWTCGMCGYINEFPVMAVLPYVPNKEKIHA